jgi:hypothetical protein
MQRTGLREWFGVVSIVLEEDYGSVLGEGLLDGAFPSRSVGACDVWVIFDRALVGAGGEGMAELFDFVGCLTVLSVLARASSVGELNDLCTDQTVRTHTFLA